MIGEKLRGCRKQKGLSLDELSSRTGFSKSFLSQIENGKNSPSIASLKKIADALCVSIGEMFDTGHTGKVCFVKKADRRLMHGKGVEFAFVSSRVAGRKMEVILTSIEPGGQSEGMYTHEGEEFGTVIEGSLVLELDGTEYLMEEGDTIYFSSTIPHRFWNTGVSTARTIWVITPPSF
jgi:transcriptional regulator with XRE-family HTH domain